ncbi:TRAP transporter substrate-binding protein [Lichenihabitans sp. PAMC28606]|uniref:TRAP transporter substrate-binding protein n=1 Tax=Lichenihabitans sp. PAMC28606 TaxID=2880932 RepID=UPI0029CAC56E|nr:TRAP transporter substrate-binding protein [Lichenihabitans sp. PAMC28606]
MKTGVGRRRFIATAAATGVLVAGTARGEDAPSAATPTPDVIWRLTSSFPKSLDLMFGGAETFARVVGDLTGGRFRIDVLAPGDAVSGLQALDAVQAGTVEACHTSMDYFYGKDPTFALATAIPFGLNARGQAAYAYEGGGNDLFNEFLGGYGVLAFPAGNTGAQMGGFFRKPVKSVADLQGLKIRIGGLAGKVLQQLGAIPQATPRADLYTALDQGTIDAATWVSPYDDDRLASDEKTALQKVAPNYYYPGWWRGGSVIHVAFNKAKYEALPAPFRAALKAAAMTANTEMLARYDARNPAALKRLVVSGAQLRAFPQDVLEAAFKTTNDVLHDIADGNPHFKAVLDSTVNFRSEEYLWWQVGEYTFDNFMIRQRAKG